MRVSLGVKFALTGWGWGKCWGPGPSGVAPAEVLDRFICLRTPFQFLPGPGGLSPVSPGEGLSDALEASRRESRTVPSPTQRSHLTSLLPSCTCSRQHHPGSLWSRFHSRCDYNGKNREKGRPGAQGIVTLVNRLSSAQFASPHPEADPELKLVSASCPSGLHRYLIRPLPVPLSVPSSGGSESSAE